MILANGTILKATAVDFPQKPTISSLTMDFIRKCLQFEVVDRPDVSEISKHDYVKPFTRKWLCKNLGKCFSEILSVFFKLKFASFFLRNENFWF